ncbi:MAG: DUF1801 domain-containing protein [Phycisphaerae bacterium]
MQSKAATVAEYIASLPSDRREAIEAVRAVMNENLDPDYAEGMGYGMILWYVPHAIFPDGYHCDPKMPLGFAALASQKNYLSLYMSSIYSGCADGTDTPRSAWFKREWAKTGKKLDAGKSCIRFRTVDDLALDVIAEAVRDMPVKKWVETYLAVVKDARKRKPGTAKPKAAKPAKATVKKKPAAKSAKRK